MSPTPNHTNPETKYECGQLLHDRDGVVNHSSETTLLLLSRDMHDGDYWWRAACYTLVLDDGTIGGAQIREFFEVDLDRCEPRGRIEFPWHGQSAARAALGEARKPD